MSFMPRNFVRSYSDLGCFSTVESVPFSKVGSGSGSTALYKRVMVLVRPWFELLFDKNRKYILRDGKIYVWEGTKCLLQNRPDTRRVHRNKDRAGWDTFRSQPLLITQNKNSDKWKKSLIKEQNSGKKAIP